MRLLTCLLVLGCLSACSQSTSLDDQTFDQYVKAIQNLQTTYPALASKLKIQGESSLQPADVDKLDSSVREAGFSNLQDFIAVNGQVAASMTRLKFEQTLKEQQGKFQQGVDRSGQALKDQQARLQQGLDRLGGQLNQLNADSQGWWANLTSDLKQRFNLSGQQASDQSVETVKKHLEKLKQIF